MTRSPKNHNSKTFGMFKALGFVWLVLLFHNSVQGQAHSAARVEIPEPLLFDLVRGLGAAQGELEINALADIPLNNTDQRGVEWAPEIEYALFDGFAIELEFPMTDGDLEAYKMAVQWTMGSAKNKKFIHGIQLIAEKYVHERYFGAQLPLCACLSVQQNLECYWFVWRHAGIGS